MIHAANKWLIVYLLVLSRTVAIGQASLTSELVSLSVEHVSLEHVLMLLEKQTSIAFAYNPNNLPVKALVTLYVEDKPLTKALEILSANLHLEYELIEKQIVLRPGTNVPPLEFIVSGNIIDKQTGESLIGATVFTDSLSRGAVSNGYGYFSLNLPYGTQTLHFSYLGYEIDTQTVDVLQNTELSITLNQSAPQLKEIVVRGYKPINVNLTQTGSISLSPKAIAEAPAVFGENDVIKSLEMVPGINLQSEGSTFFYVRGGNKDQNLVLIDDAPIYNPTHMLGLFSSIVPDAANSIDVYKSDFPLSKGGRLSSVIDIKTKEGNKNRFSVWGNLGFISTHLGMEGPLKKGHSSYIISGRISQIKWLFRNEIDDLEDFQFYDLTGKLNFKVNTNNKLYFSFYTGSDRFLTNTTGLSWTNINGSVRWNNLVNKNTFANTTLYGSNYEYFFYIDRVKEESWRSRIGELGLKSDFTHFVNNNQELSFGLNINGRTINPGNIISQDSIPEEFIVSVKNNLEMAGYLQHEIKLGTQFGIKYGLRSSLWTSLGEAFEYVFDDSGNAIDTTAYQSNQAYHTYFKVEPRITASYSISENSALKASYGRSVQNLHLITNSISPFTSFEVWLPSGPNIKPQLADQFSFSYNYYWSKVGILFEAESYFKVLKNQIDYSTHTSTLLNPTIESELSIGKAKSYGLEVLLRKEEGRLRGLMGYTISKVRSQSGDINQGNAYNAFSDRPHHLSVNLSYDLGLRVTLGTNFNLTSGLPFSSPTSFYTFDDIEIPVYEQKNNDRFPTYHRLDFSAKFILNKNLNKHFRHSLTLSVYNIYGRKNPIFINFNKSQNEQGEFEIPTNLITAARVTTQTYIYRITPSLSYHFRF